MNAIGDASAWFHRHHPPRPYDGHQQTQQEEPMALADIAAALRTDAEEAAARARVIVDQHLPQLDDLAQLVSGNPVFRAAQGAMHVPAEHLAPVAAVLDTLAAAFPRPEATAEAPAQ